MYRGKFLIGIYALEKEGETCLNICEDIKEFANYTRMSRNSATVILHKLFRGQRQHICLGGKLRTVAFIDLEEDE